MIFQTEDSHSPKPWTVTHPNRGQSLPKPSDQLVSKLHTQRDNGWKGRLRNVFIRLHTLMKYIDDFDMGIADTVENRMRANKCTVIPSFYFISGLAFKRSFSKLIHFIANVFKIGLCLVSTEPGTSVITNTSEAELCLKREDIPSHL